MPPLSVRLEWYNYGRIMQVEAKTLCIRRLDEESEKDNFEWTTPAQRLEIMWQLTLDAWAFRGEPIAEFQWDAVRVIRLDAKNPCHF